MIRNSLITILALSLSACAAQSKPAATPEPAPAEPSPPPSATGGEPAAEEGGGAQTATPESSPTAAPPPPPGTTPKASEAPKTPPVDAGGASAGKKMTIGAAQASFDDARKTFIAASDCIHMCKALTSMTNATTRLCELTQGGAEQKRCTEAKAKLAAADTKVKTTCGDCAL